GREQAEPAVDFLFHVFGGRDEGVPELPQLAVADSFHESVDVIVRQRPQPRMLAAKGHRFKKGHLILRYKPRHCLRQTRSVCARERSDEAIHLSPCGGMDCFAALAMTDVITCSKNSVP